MIDAISHNMPQHITEQLIIQEKDKKSTKPQTKPLLFLKQERKESDFHERNPGTKEPKGEENNHSNFSLL